jgi:hypothetical protein
MDGHVHMFFKRHTWTYSLNIFLKISRICLHIFLFDEHEAYGMDKMGGHCTWIFGCMNNSSG